MRAIVNTRYSPPDVLQLREDERPAAGENQVLVRVNAASVNTLNHQRCGSLLAMCRLMEKRFLKSIGKVLGADIAGVVEPVGGSVKQFKLGDEVFAVILLFS